MKYVFPALLVLALGACDKEIPDEIVNPPEAEHPGGDGNVGDGFGDGWGDGDEASMDAGTTPRSDASVIPDLDASPPPPPPETFSKKALLEASGACAVRHAEAFDGAVATLVTAARAFETERGDAQKTAVRAAFRSAFAALQRAELFRFGPGARAMDDPGGQDLRDQMYAYPQNLTCVVDQRIVDQRYQTGYASILIGARGFSSLEYLLFNESPGNTCASAIGINSSGTWDALGEAEVNARRAAYAARSAEDVQQRSAQLLTAWSPSGGKFLTTLTEPGSGRTYASEQAALNAVSHGLFYLETEIKDWKLGLPLGLVEGCASTTCPNLVESRFARVSTDNLRQNLVGFRRLFQGCDDDYAGFGFDDWLVEVGADDLNTRMLAALTGAQRSVEELDPPIEQAIASAPERVRAVHTAIKALNDLLKTEFVSALNLELPMGAEGDND